MLWHTCFPVNFAKFLRTPLVAFSVSFFIKSAGQKHWWNFNLKLSQHVTFHSYYFGIMTLSEKCPNMEFFLVHIFPYSGWIRRFTHEKYEPEKTSYLDTFHAVWLSIIYKTMDKFELFLESLSFNLSVKNGAIKADEKHLLSVSTVLNNSFWKSFHIIIPLVKFCYYYFYMFFERLFQKLNLPFKRCRWFFSKNYFNFFLA